MTSTVFETLRDADAVRQRTLEVTTGDVLWWIEPTVAPGATPVEAMALGGWPTASFDELWAWGLAARGPSSGARRTVHVVRRGDGYMFRVCDIPPSSQVMPVWLSSDAARRRYGASELRGFGAERERSSLMLLLHPDDPTMYWLGVDAKRACPERLAESPELQDDVKAFGPGWWPRLKRWLGLG